MRCVGMCGIGGQNHQDDEEPECIVRPEEPGKDLEGAILDATELIFLFRLKGHEPTLHIVSTLTTERMQVKRPYDPALAEKRGNDA